LNKPQFLWMPGKSFIVHSGSEMLEIYNFYLS